MSNYIFTEDWFSHNIHIWDQVFKNLKNVPNLNFLEIGSYQGRSTIWLLENVLTHLTSKISCIDTFEGSIEHTENQKKNLYDIFIHNIKNFQDKVTIYKGKSQEILKILNNTYDFIYIDGDHRARYVLEDAILSHSLLKKGGILIFDDYVWGDLSTPLMNPKYGIDIFIMLYGNEYKLVYNNYQMILQKKD